MSLFVIMLVWTVMTESELVVQYAVIQYFFLGMSCRVRHSCFVHFFVIVSKSLRTRIKPLALFEAVSCALGHIVL